MKIPSWASFAPIWVLFAILFIGLVFPAGAAPINYDESISGDLPYSAPSGFPLTTFTFDVGTNIITGTATASRTTIDMDSFAFIVPTGMQVVRVGLVAVDAGDNTLLNSLDWVLNEGSVNFNSGTFVTRLSVSSPGSAEYTGILGPETYNMTGGGYGYSNQGGMGKYTFTFDVNSTAIPEPSALALLVIGGALLLLRRFVW